MRQSSGSPVFPVDEKGGACCVLLFRGGCWNKTNASVAELNTNPIRTNAGHMNVVAPMYPRDDGGVIAGRVIYCRVVGQQETLISLLHGWRPGCSSRGGRCTRWRGCVDGLDFGGHQAGVERLNQ